MKQTLYHCVLNYFIVSLLYLNSRRFDFSQTILDALSSVGKERFATKIKRECLKEKQPTNATIHSNVQTQDIIIIILHNVRTLHTNGNTYNLGTALDGQSIGGMSKISQQ